MLLDINGKIILCRQPYISIGENAIMRENENLARR